MKLPTDVYKFHSFNLKVTKFAETSTGVCAIFKKMISLDNCKEDNILHKRKSGNVTIGVIFQQRNGGEHNFVISS